MRFQRPTKRNFSCHVFICVAVRCMQVNNIHSIFPRLHGRLRLARKTRPGERTRSEQKDRLTTRGNVQPVR